MYDLYKLRERDFEAISFTVDEDGKSKLEEKIRVGEEVIGLRDAVNRRFYSLNGDNRGHFQWILKLRSEIDHLKKISQEFQQPSDPLTEGPRPSESPEGPKEQGDVRVYRSLISPEVPMSALDHLPRDSPAVVIKSFLNMAVDGLVDRLYGISPSLDDSRTSVPGSDTAEEQSPSTDDLVIRYILREFLVWKADTKTLARASRTSTIDQFLRHSIPEELEGYIKFFQALGRQDTLHFLRDAVYDYLLPNEGPSTMMILGASVSTDSTGRRMTVEAWDIVHCYFWNLVEWWNVEQLCFSFEDLVLVKRLVALRRYGDSEDTEANWYRPEDDFSQENEIAVLQGFVALLKGFQDPICQQFSSRPGEITEVESRCYLVGRMGKSDPSALPLIKELSVRIARFIVIATDFESTGCWLPFNDKQDDKELPFIRRTRSAKNKDALPDAPWVTEWSVKSILDDVRFIRARREREGFENFHLIIVIDREPGKQFTILQETAEALREVAGDHSTRDIFDRAITESIPASEQETWKEAFLSHHSSAVFDPADVSPHYEGHRVRQWDIVDKFPDFAHSHAEVPKTYSDIRFIRKVLSEMESQEVITLLETFEAPQSTPLLYRGIDGQQDLFFPYQPATPVDDKSIQKKAFMSAEVNIPPGSLYNFAKSYQAKHPDAVFAKGRIHTHYCAWPLRNARKNPANFKTAQGHIYRWNAFPFDECHSTREWQWFLHMAFNEKLSFVRCLRTTFVVCAESRDTAEENMRVLAHEAEKNKLQLSVKPVSLWVGDVDSLGLKKPWKGVPPDA